MFPYSLVCACKYKYLDETLVQRQAAETLHCALIPSVSMMNVLIQNNPPLSTSLK